MAEVMIFHYRDNDNFLVRLNPNTKLVLLLSYSVTVSAMQPDVVLPLSILPVVVALVIKLPLLSYLKESLFFIIIAVLMGFSRYISFGDWLESLSKSVSFLSTILAAVLLCDTTMPDELSRSLGKALSHIIGKYAYVLSAVMEITLSMIPIIIDSALSMLEARRARGASLSRHPFREVCQISISILSDILDKAEIYADALYSRGYDVSATRCTASYSFRDCFLIACGIVSFPILYFYIH